MTPFGFGGAAAGLVVAAAAAVSVLRDARAPGASRPRSPGNVRVRKGPGGRGGGGRLPWGPRVGGLPSLLHVIRGGRAGPTAASWATRRELGPLVVKGREPGRLVLGTLDGPGWRATTLLAAEPAQSVAVVGPTQSGKTTGLAVPAILGWDGPVVAASVKTDLVRDTLALRGRRGRVWCFDPAGTTGVPASKWSPLPAAATWAGARRVAADLTEVARGPGTTADGEFWYSTAAKLLAPLLFAASSAGLEMADVVRWVDTQEVEEVLAILAASGVAEAMQAARATWHRDDRQRSSVYTTAETVLEPFAASVADGTPLVPAAHPWDGPRWSGSGSPPPARSDDTPPLGTPVVGAIGPAGGGAGGWAVDAGAIDPDALLLGSNTLYLCAPAHDQRRLRGVFSALVKQVLEAAFERSARINGPLSPPLLVVLDEAANITPLTELDGLAATCAGHGVQLVTVWQDLSQIIARYGERASTVVNNHRAKVFLSGTSDPRTLDHASHLVGDEELLVPSVTRERSGARTVTSSPVRRPLLPPEALRRLEPGTGVLLYGSLPPALLRLRPWFDDPAFAADREH